MKVINDRAGASLLLAFIVSAGAFVAIPCACSSSPSVSQLDLSWHIMQLRAVADEVLLPQGGAARDELNHIATVLASCVDEINNLCSNGSALRAIQFIKNETKALLVIYRDDVDILAREGLVSDSARETARNVIEFSFSELDEIAFQIRNAFGVHQPNPLDRLSLDDLFLMLDGGIAFRERDYGINAEVPHRNAPHAVKINCYRERIEYLIRYFYDTEENDAFDRNVVLRRRYGKHVTSWIGGDRLGLHDTVSSGHVIELVESLNFLTESAINFRSVTRIQKIGRGDANTKEGAADLAFSRFSGTAPSPFPVLRIPFPSTLTVVGGRSVLTASPIAAFGAQINYDRNFYVADTTGVPNLFLASEFFSFRMDLVSALSPGLRIDNFVMDLQSSETGWGNRLLVPGDYEFENIAVFRSALTEGAISRGENFHLNYPVTGNLGSTEFRGPLRMEIDPAILNRSGDTFFVLRSEPDDVDIIPRDFGARFADIVMGSTPTLVFKVAGMRVTAKRPTVCGTGTAPYRIATGVPQPDLATLTPLPILTGTAVQDSGLLRIDGPGFSVQSVSGSEDVVITEYDFESRNLPFDEIGRSTRLTVFLFPEGQLAAVRVVVSGEVDARDEVARELRELYRDISRQRAALARAEKRLSDARNDNQRRSAQAAVDAAQQAIDSLRDRIGSRQADLDDADDALLSALVLIVPPAFDSDDAVIPVVPVQIEESFEADNTFNRVPRIQQPRQQRLYIAVEGSGMFELVISGDFQQCCDSARNEFLWRVRDGGRTAATGVCLRGADQIPIAFGPTGNMRVYTVELGVDVDGDGVLQNSEITSSTLGTSTNPLTVLGVTTADYTSARADLIILAQGADIGGRNFASRFLFRFLDELGLYSGDITPSATVLGTVQASDDRLTHAVGANLAIPNNVALERYADGTEPSNDIEESKGLKNTIKSVLDSHGAEVQQFFVDNPGIDVHVFDFAVPATTPIDLGADGQDLAVSIGRARVDGTLQVNVRRKTNGKIESTSVTIDLVLTDLYDYDYEAGFPAPLAAKLQIGFDPAIGRRAGGIFLDEVELARTLAGFRHKFN